MENSNPKIDLHLTVSVRSFRSEKVSEFVHSILENDADKASKLYMSLSEKYPIRISRSLESAKKWIHHVSRGNERIGLICSSGANRLRPLGIYAKNEIEAPNWFLNPKEDVRSSNFLEEVATEFDIQGLEIDWAIIAWDGDLYYRDSKWNYQNFSGTKWMKIKKEVNKNYKLNAYRVLLTRSRQGMVLFIPKGSSNDHTRPKQFYDGTYSFFRQIGIEEI